MILMTTMAVVIRVVPFFAAICGGLLLAFVWYFKVSTEPLPACASGQGRRLMFIMPQTPWRGTDANITVYLSPTLDVCVQTYMRASGTVKKLHGSSTSLLLAHVSETLSGMSVIAAFEAESRFIADNRQRLKNMHVAGTTIDQLQGWLSFRLDGVASLLVLGTCLLCVGLRGSISAASAGLAISNSFQILLFMTLMVKGAADIHANISSVERVVANTDVEAEPDVPLTHESCPEQSWPAHGEVAFHGVVMSYARDLPAVLKGVDFSVGRGEKIGIVGRTGAGKSSLVMALFRLAEMSKGQVSIDGVNTSVLNLTELRRRIAIVSTTGRPSHWQLLWLHHWQ